MSLIAKAEILRAIDETGFGKAALAFLRHPRFQRDEIDYKVRLAAALRAATDGVGRTGSDWIAAMSDALDHPDDNIVNWRLRRPFIAKCNSDASGAASAIERLFGARTVDGRVQEFADFLLGPGLTQPGARLCLTSVLLMASDPLAFPPVRARTLTDALGRLRLPRPSRAASVSERYRLFVDVLDSLIDYSQSSPRPLAHRLEAQGAVWCAIGGWGGSTRKDLTTGITETGDDAERDIAAASNQLANLKPTERAAVIAARRGQGRYRNALLSLWLGCSVTGCTTSAMLRASHLKPWRHASNSERLDGFNGLLLTPTLDQALDRCLISFADDGRVLISASLSADEASVLGLTPTLKLRFVLAEHRRYLKEHRLLFHQREAAFSRGSKPRRRRGRRVADAEAKYRTGREHTAP